MKVLGSVVLFLLFSCKSIAQPNLVPNSSFESNNSCPASFTSSINSLNVWVNSGNTPDYFHPCSSSFGSPQNYFGNQQAHGDSAYVGLGVYSSTIMDFREYISIPLVQPLVAGHSYQLAFYASLYDRCIYASNKLGALVSISGNLNQSNFFTHQPQVEFPQVIGDKNNWTNISGVFVAQGGEAFLYLGCFKPDASLQFDTTAHGDLSSIAYYIDDVSLIDLGAMSIDQTRAFNKPSLTAFQVDNFLLLEGESEIQNISIVDLNGRMVYSAQNLESKKLKVETSQFATGLYLIKALLNNTPFSSKIVIQSK